MFSMDRHSLAKLLSQPESERLEFKREWYALGSKRGKAEFVKDVLAMANVLREGESGFIVIGVADPRHGKCVVGVPEGPSDEQLVQILQSYARPVPVLAPLSKLAYGDVVVNVLQVDWSPYHPHFAIRDVDQILSANSVYTRHGSTIGTLTPPELETLFRAKDARLGRPTDEGPLRVGFVDLPSTREGELVIRIVNVTEEPVESIWASVDSCLIHPRSKTSRTGLLNNLTIEPGQSEEISCRPYQAIARLEDPEFGFKVWSGWVDVRLNLVYRDRDGFFQQMTREISLGR